MEDLTNVCKSIDEKRSFEDSVAPTWFTSAADATRRFSEKLLAWGVEERGAYPIMIFEIGKASPDYMRDIAPDRDPGTLVCMLLGIRPVAVEERTETHFINIFYLWFSANTNALACVYPFSSSLRNSKLRLGTFSIIDLPREPWAR